MCLIIVHADNTERVSRNVFKGYWDDNPDGFGLAYCARGKLHARLPYWSFREAWRAYGNAMAAADGPVVVHFRLSTSGKCNKENTHPHAVKCSGGERMALFHNGVLPGGDAKHSDTVLWTKMAFVGRSKRQLLSEKWINHAEQWLGFNKVVLLSHQGEVAIYNEHFGEWSGTGLWFSNTQAAMEHEGRVPTGFGKGCYREYIHDVEVDEDDDSDAIDCGTAHPYVPWKYRVTGP